MYDRFTDPIIGVAENYGDLKIQNSKSWILSIEESWWRLLSLSFHLLIRISLLLIRNITRRCQIYGAAARREKAHLTRHAWRIIGKGTLVAITWISRQKSDHLIIASQAIFCASFTPPTFSLCSFTDVSERRGNLGMKMNCIDYYLDKFVSRLSYKLLFSLKVHPIHKVKVISSIANGLYKCVDAQY